VATGKQAMEVDAQTLIRAWLFLLVIVEIPEIKSKLIDGVGFLPDGFGSNILNKAAERRLWAFMLVLLVISRSMALLHPDNSAVRLNCALVHVGELVYMGSEKLLFKSRSHVKPDLIFVLMIANALGFSYWYLIGE
jgi:hypothetical protein